ncbi:MAG TPA: homeostatic response regulator transcription factor HsrA [Sulfurovum sp.]|jgi:two-component system OmpR family response regulator|nr:MAG: DNA-binding response regulator [Sulfurovum sp. 16-42-52]OYZ50541.1 MAG: DNA-binding response regulator [Sulfurovum sp. 24-42-9]OZA46700.1 MAG: DNA-binding response regulator [Sulfurovum sp. 17-42-90]OZA60465.1 MAG: DNA-binding response regulator [Sulfurovum sp. 39-42-12]HQR73166.1 homeostatic response regulator transcription factor HsrA [Sulfurovum sp.]
MRILIVENDATLSKTISDTLAEEGYQNDIAENLSDAKYFIEIRNYDLVLLSWPIAQENSLDMISTIKTEAHKTSVIVLSERDDKGSEIKALKSGADDYIKKPLDYDILLVRIEAKLRFGVSNIIEIDDLIINPEEEKIIYQGEEIELKGKPFEVLTHLAMHKDQIVSKEQLLDAIWEEPELVTPNVIEVAINQIRQKMDKPLDITTIETVRRRGYRFCFPKKIN